MYSNVKDDRSFDLVKGLLVAAIVLLCFYTISTFASAGGTTPTATEGSIGSVADNIRSNFSSLAEVITAGAYIGGMGFVLGAIFKFKAHKDNPTQIPVGTPIALLFIGAAMLFLPQIFTVSGKTMFGSTASVGGVGGVTSFGSFTGGN